MKQAIDAEEVTAVVRALVEGVQSVLGNQFVGAYVIGSLTTGEFDEASDIDVVIVTTDAISDELFDKLAAMHERLATRESRWATQLEASYISREELRRHDLKHPMHPHLDRGEGERLKRIKHETDWVAQRHMLRERGLTLVGPDPKTLIDPVSPDELRDAMRPLLHGWVKSILKEKTPFASRGYQSYIVLTVCRILYTLEHGDVATKRAAAKWAEEELHERWHPLIQRAWIGRQDSGSPPEDTKETLAFIRHALEHP
jgi:predicted nucleotidyltransferase